MALRRLGRPQGRDGAWAGHPGFLQSGKPIGQCGALVAGHAVEGLEEKLVAPFTDLGQVSTSGGGHAEPDFAAAVGARPAFDEARTWRRSTRRQTEGGDAPGAG